MPGPPASTFEPTRQTSRCSRTGARTSGLSSSRSASRSGRRPRARSESPALPALSPGGLRDRLDELTCPLLALSKRDVGLGNDADESAVLDDGQPPYLVAGHEPERFFEVFVGLDADEVLRVDVSDRRGLGVGGLGDHSRRDVSVGDHPYKLLV